MDKLWISKMYSEGNALSEAERKNPFTRKTKAGEKVLGTVAPDLRGLVYMAQKKKGAAKTMAEELMKFHREEKSHDESVCEAKLADLSQLKADADLLLEIFWNEVRHAIADLTGVECITVTDDWNVVAETVRDRPPDMVMVSFGTFGLR